MLEKKELKKTVKDIKKLKAKREEIESQIAELENLVKADMTERAVDSLVVDEYKIKYSDVVSNRFDTTTFKKECADLYNRYVKVSVSKRFTIA